MNSRAIVLVAALAVVAVTAPWGVACGAEQSGDGEMPTVLTVEQALASEQGSRVTVRGALVATDADMVLTSALRESYPPQAGGATIPLAGLDIGSLVGLSSTAGQPDLANVVWSDYWLTIEGTIEDGVLRVDRTPRVVQETSDGIRTRFSPVSEPIVAGDTVWWAFEVENVTSEPIDLVFTSGQKGEVVLTQNGVQKYRWSADKVFTEAIETVVLGPGESVSVVLNDVPAVVAGQYELAGRITASIGAEGSGGGGEPGSALAEVRTTLTVY